MKEDMTNYSKLLISIIYRTVSNYHFKDDNGNWKDNIKDHNPKIGDWAIEASTLVILDRTKISYKSHIMKILEMNNISPSGDVGEYVGISIEGKRIRWTNAMFYRFPDNMQKYMTVLSDTVIDSCRRR